jgi:hypothetical protein
MSRRIFVAFTAALALLAFSVPALAKEGAVTKFDSLPTEWHAGQTYSLGYTIKMDGVEPYKADRTEIIANTIDGKTSLVFPGIADGAPGHYVAKVTFPSVGTWQWKVIQGSYFAPFDLGSISVLPAVPASGGTAPAAPLADAFTGSLPILGVAAVAIAFALAITQRRRLMRTA